MPTTRHYSTDDIRNIALVGMAGAGKTTLAEALLFEAKAIHERGTIERGTTTSDFTSEEQHYQHSLSPAFMNLTHQGKHINLIDTPGYPDFMGQTYSVLPAVETMALVINAQTGVDMVARRLMHWAKEHNYCRMIVVNKIDSEGIRLAALMEEIRDAFGPECLPIDLPAKDGIKDVVFHEDGDAEFSSVNEAHTQIMEQIVELNEQVMNEYLENGDVSPDHLHDSFEQAMREGHLVPVCFTSARDDVGVRELLDVFSVLMPNPHEGTVHRFVDEAPQEHEIEADQEADDPLLAHVCRVSHDPYAGKLGIFRIHQGRVNKDTQLYMQDQRKGFKVGHLFQLQGNDQVEIEEAVAGDICAVAKIDELQLDTILHDSPENAHVHTLSNGLPRPTVGLAILPSKRGDEQKLSEALEKLTAEDPCLRVEHEQATNETVLRGLGEMHLKIAIERLKERFNTEVKTHTPSVPYRETIAGQAEGHYRHKKQTGGAGQFGEVFLRIEPMPRDTGFEFVNAVTGGSIPGQFIPAVEKGVRQALADGAIAGYPILDVRVTVYDGKHHNVDSNEVSFVMAGKKAFLEAFSHARPVVLEPIVNLDITAPHTSMGDITGDLASRRGRINDTRTETDGKIQIAAQAPMAELEDYPTRIKALTGGEGFFVQELDHYEPVPGNVQKELVSRYKPQAEA